MDKAQVPKEPAPQILLVINEDGSYGVFTLGAEARVTVLDYTSPAREWGGQMKEQFISEKLVEAQMQEMIDEYEYEEE
jgi:hypothetical protein